MKSMNLIHLYVDDTIRLRGRQSYFFIRIYWDSEENLACTIVKSYEKIP